jgi:UDP-N-acetylglucosamine 2-epimerase (non-hydrolysing)
MVLVQGDTTSVLAGALASFYRRVPVGHVEAGLRTGDLSAPFPEEANRRLTTPLVDLHFAPTTTSRDNLLREHVDAARVHVTGNTVIDALQMEVSAQQVEPLASAMATRVDVLLEGDDRPLVLITGHRRENFGGPFENICQAIRLLAQRFADHQFVYPVHLNPQVRKVVFERLGHLSNVRLIEPLGYRDFVALMNRCRLVLTDSGGVQEEAPGLGKPVLVMRDTTERPEGVTAGTVKLVGSDSTHIAEAVTTLLTDREAYERMARAVNPYGDGHAAARIVQVVESFFGHAALA